MSNASKESQVNNPVHSKNQSNDTYHSYQQVWAMKSNVNSKEMISKKQRKKSIKTTTGCLNCKRRRKKCDEVKPNCKGCLRNNLQCAWPEHVVQSMNKEEPEQEGTDHAATIVQTQTEEDQSTALVLTDTGSDDNYVNFIKEYSQIAAQENNPSLFFNMDQFMETDTDFLSNVDLSNSDCLLDQFLFIQQENNNNTTTTTTTSNSVHLKASKTHAVPSFPTMNEYEHSITDGKLYDIPGLRLSYYDKVCYSYFVDKFLLSVTPPHCNQFISPIKILLPFLVTNRTVRETFLACGASFHAFNNDKYVKMANDRYSSCVNMLIKDIQSSVDGCEDHLFICAQLLQTLCLRDKNIGSNATKCAAHLSASYEIIKKRYIKNNNRSHVTPLDRILTEHFIFNYPFTILLCHSEKLFEKIIPSPFQFFDQFNDLLQQPFDPTTTANSDPFLNHPVLGVSLKAYEVASKLSWICRFYRKSMAFAPDKAQLWQRYSEIPFALMSETRANLQELDQLFQSASLNDDERLNISITKITVNANILILKKLCHEFKPKPAAGTDLQLQEECQAIATEIQYSYSKCPDPFLDGWAIFVCGLLTTDPTIQTLIEDCYVTNSNEVNSSLSLKILKFLKVFWQDSQRDGFEVLFDTTTLDIICM